MFIFDNEEINLLEAAQDGKLEFIKTQLAPLSSDNLQIACKKTDYYGRNALHYAAYRGHFDVVEYFIDLQCININSIDNKENTPLMLACVRGFNTDNEELADGRKYRICRLLIQRGAEMNQYAKHGINNPLHWACYFSDLKTAWILLQNIPDLMLYKNDRDMFPIDNTLMSRKEFQNRHQNELVVEYLIIKFLVQYLGSETHQQQLLNLDLQSERSFEISIKQKIVADIKKYEQVGLRYLFWASILGRENLVKPLLKYKFSPFKASYRGRNAVHAASYHGHLHLLKLFFEAEYLADKKSIKKTVNLMTLEKPQTALHIAVERGHEQVVAYLVELGADHTFYNFRNHRAFDSSRLPNIKKLRQNLIKDDLKNMIRAGYQYVLVGYRNIDQRGSLVEQQLKNIQEKNQNKGKFKIMPIPSYDEHHIIYVIKVEDRLKNEIADEDQMMIFNQCEGFICQFQKDYQSLYENFHHIHDQQILLRLIYDEFDIDKFISDGLLKEHFPLHEEQEKAQIYRFWNAEKWQILIEPFSLKDSSTRTASALQSYFGAEVGFFFVFLCFFTTWLILPATPGILVFVYAYVTGDKSSSYVPIYILFLAVWATIFFEFWKRKQSETMFLFDMHIAEEKQRKLPQFKGEFIIEDVSHLIEIKDRRNIHFKYFSTVLPLIGLAVILIAAQQIAYFLVIDLIENSLAYKYGCACGLGLCTIITNEIFNYFARKTLSHENHEYQDERENVYIMKVFSFAFCNSFSRLFYKSIIVADAIELEILANSFTFIWAVVHIIRFIVYPKILFQITRYNFNRHYKIYQQRKWKKQVFSITLNKFTSQRASVIDSETTSIFKQYEKKGEIKKFIEEVEYNRILMPPPDHTQQFTYFVNYYLSISTKIIQFCMVTMFSSSSQIVPIFLLITNFINLEGLLHGYITFVKRPIAEPKKSIGPWNDILLIVGYIGTVINCLTIYTANQEQLNNLIGQPTNSKGEVDLQELGLRNFLLLIAAEHIVIGLKFIIESVIPDEPDWVLTVLKRQEFLIEQMKNRVPTNVDNSIQMTKQKKD